MRATQQTYGTSTAFAAAAITIAAVVIPAVTPARASAQRIAASVDLQDTRLRYADTVKATAAGITPSVRADWDLATISAYGTYARLANAWSADGSAEASLFTPTRHGWSGELSGELGGSTHEDRTRTAAAMAIGRLHLDGASVGAWLGAGGGATSDGFVWRDVRQGEAGLWLARGPASLTLSALPATVDDSIRYTDLAAQGSWHAGRLELDALIGSRAGARLPDIASDATTWGSATVALWVMSRAAIVASAGTYPVDYTQGFPGGRFASIGVRLALTRRPERSGADVPLGTMATGNGVSELRVSPVAHGVTTIRARASGARSVEIMGDLTGWKARRLTPATDGWFSVTMPASAGTSQIMLRINGGAWGPPTGLPMVRDEFGGTAGVLVIE